MTRCPEPWGADFSYEYYCRILNVIKDKFDVFRVAEAPTALKQMRRRLIFRHDVDVSLDLALEMAKIEHDAGLRATYMVIPDCLLYSIEDPQSRAILRELVDLGHEVGLHFDLRCPERSNNASIAEVAPALSGACERLEFALGGAKVRSVSFHRPIQAFLAGPLLIGDRVNAYAAEIFSGCYLSDSKGSWREGEPIRRLVNYDLATLQLLTHPIWWGDKHMPATNRLQEFFEAKTQGKPMEVAAEFGRRLSIAVPGVQRSGLQQVESEMRHGAR